MQKRPSAEFQSSFESPESLLRRASSTVSLNSFIERSGHCDLAEASDTFVPQLEQARRLRHTSIQTKCIFMTVVQFKYMTGITSAGSLSVTTFWYLFKWLPKCSCGSVPLASLRAEACNTPETPALPG